MAMRVLAIFGVCVVVAVGIQHSDAQKTYCEENPAEATAKQEGNHCFLKAAGSEDALDKRYGSYYYNMTKADQLCQKTYKGHLPKLSGTQMTMEERKAFYDLAAATNKDVGWPTGCVIQEFDSNTKKTKIECGFGDEVTDPGNVFTDGKTWERPKAGFFGFYHAKRNRFKSVNVGLHWSLNKDMLPVMCHQVKTVATQTDETRPETPNTATPPNKASVNSVETLATALIVILAAFVM